MYVGEFNWTFLFSTVYLYLLNVVIARRQLTTLSIQSVPFEDVREGKRFENDGSLLATKSFATQPECALRCNRHAKCRSFNVCSNHICQLNLDDIFSTVAKDALLKKDEYCYYVGMKKTSFPNCQTRGEPVSIREDNDNAQGACEINLKRVDKQWTNWEPENIDTDSEYKVSRSRTVILEAAHGGVSEGVPVEVTIWLRFISQKTSFVDAKANCERLGGRLFTGLDGTVSQAQFLFEKSGNEPSWSGYFKINNAHFVDLDGKTVDNDVFNWRPENPGSPEEQYVSFGWDGSYKQVDIGSGYNFRSVCDIK